MLRRCGVIQDLHSFWITLSYTWYYFQALCQWLHTSRQQSGYSTWCHYECLFSINENAVFQIFLSSRFSASDWEVHLSITIRLLNEKAVAFKHFNLPAKFQVLCQRLNGLSLDNNQITCNHSGCLLSRPERCKIFVFQVLCQVFLSSMFSASDEWFNFLATIGSHVIILIENAEAFKHFCLPCSLPVI